METTKPKVAIMYLLWDQEPYAYLEDAIKGVADQTYSKEHTEFLMVYNAHRPENDSAAPYIREHFEKNKDKLPHFTILEQETNLGFSGGNNFGMQWAIDNGFDYVFLHNGDGYLGPNYITEMVKAMEADKTIGAAQSMVLLHPETNLINTSGNCLHYLGTGYCNHYRMDITKVDLPAVYNVGYISGASIMMRTELLKKHGLWEEDYFMYHEDTEYSLRMKSLGYRIVAVRDAEFFHKYQFSKSIKKYYWMERNRYSVTLTYYKWPTLLLLLPMNLIFEAGLLLFSFKGGWTKEKLKVYGYWLQPKHWMLWLKKRKEAQKNRVISDRQMLANAVSTVEFQEAAVRNPVLDYIGNPIMKLYWTITYALIRW